jgi:hypothetical protein
MFANSLPSDPHARSRLIDQARGLCANAHALRGTAPGLATPVLEAACAWAGKAAGQLTPEEAWSLLMAMGAPAVEEALLPASSGAQRLLERAKPAFPAIKRLHNTLFHISEADLGALRALGLPYDALLESDQAAYLWMVRGSAFGAQAWRARNARRHPVLGWWAAHGFHIPRDGLCAEGAALMEDAIRKLCGPSKMTMELAQSLHKNGRDLRVALAFATLGDPIRVAHSRNLPSDWKPFLDQVLPTTSSAHTHLRAAQLRAGMPAIQGILMMDIDQASPEAFFSSAQPIHG